MLCQVFSYRLSFSLSSSPSSFTPTQSTLMREQFPSKRHRHDYICRHIENFRHINFCCVVYIFMLWLTVDMGYVGPPKRFPLSFVRCGKRWILLGDSWFAIRVTKHYCFLRQRNWVQSSAVQHYTAGIISKYLTKTFYSSRYIKSLCLLFLLIVWFSGNTGNEWEQNISEERKMEQWQHYFVSRTIVSWET